MRYQKLKSLIIFTLFSLLAGGNLTALGDSVELVSGEIIKGEVISVNSSVVVIYKKPDKIKINRNKVKQIVFMDSEPVQIAQKVENIQQKPSETNNKKTDKIQPDKNVASKTLPPLDKTEKKVESKNIDKEKPETPKDDKKTKIQPDKALPASDKVTSKTNEQEKLKVTQTPISPQSETNSKSKPQLRPATPIKTAIRSPGSTPLIDYLTYITGSATKKMYLGIYSNETDKNNLTIYLSDKSANRISFKLHAQKNGKIPSLYTAASVIFVDKSGNIIGKSNPMVVDNDSFVEWFSNLENVAGITGDKFIDIALPENTYAVKILGYRPGSKNNLVGYISDVKVGNSPVSQTHKL